MAIEIKHVIHFLLGISLYQPQPPELNGRSDEGYRERGRCLLPICKDRPNDSYLG